MVIAEFVHCKAWSGLCWSASNTSCHGKRLTRPQEKRSACNRWGPRSCKPYRFQFLDEKVGISCSEQACTNHSPRIEPCNHNWWMHHQAEQSLERLPNIQTSHRFRSIDLDSYWSKQSLHNHFVRSYTNWLVWRKRRECNTCAGFRTDQWIKSLAKLAKAKARERKTNTWLAAWLILFHMYIIAWIYSELHAIASESVNTVSVSRCVMRVCMCMISMVCMCNAPPYMLEMWILQKWTGSWWLLQSANDPPHSPAFVLAQGSQVIDHESHLEPTVRADTIEASR